MFAPSGVSSFSSRSRCNSPRCIASKIGANAVPCGSRGPNVIVPILFFSQVRRIGACRAPCSRAISRGIGTGEPPSSLPNKDAKSAEQFLKSAWLPARHAGGHSIDI
ncbi:hypothetical protein, partial [Burkholderia thailandensis]